MFKWTQESIAYMDDACRRTDFHRKLTAELQPYLRETDCVCDAGCGLGYLSLSLAPYVGAVTAVERDSQALAVLEREVKARGIGNVTAVRDDVLAYRPDTRFDAMVFCFFGSIEEILATAARCCRGTVLAVVRNDARHRFSGKSRGPGRHSYDTACRILTEKGINFTTRTASFAFDQPFRSLEAARRFFELYGGSEDWRGRLAETDDPEFPWRLPSRRDFGLIVFQAGDGNSTSILRHEPGK